MMGWECPKCGYTYSNAVAGCHNCNRPAHEKVSSGTTIKIAMPKSQCCACQGSSCSHTGECGKCEDHGGSKVTGRIFQMNERQA